LGNLFVRFGMGMISPHDWTSGYRMMRTQVYQKVVTGIEKYSGYTFQVAFLHRVKVNKYKIAEVPLQFVDRIHGKSKIAPSDYIKNLIIYVLDNSTLIKYVIIGGVGFTVQTIVSKILVMAGIFPGTAVLVGSFCAIITNFLGNNLWTFSHKKISGVKNYITKFIHFCVTSIGAVIIQAVVVSVGVLVFGHQSWFWLMVVAIIFLVIPYNYFIYNRFIWKTHE
jgi:dolichol-phosphate mannosyltransferase